MSSNLVISGSREGLKAAVRAEGRPVALPSLTGLRWTAALMVFFYHVHVVEYFGGRGQDLVTFAFGVGSTGVSFFFVLSGFVLAWSTPTSPTGWGMVRFWRRRLARIYPLHLATVLAALALVYFLGAGEKPTAGPLLANLSLVQSWIPEVRYFQGLNPVSWSLAVEAFFYVGFPLLILPLRRLGRHAPLVVAGLSLAVIVAIPTVWELTDVPDGAIWANYFFPLYRLPEFILGITLAELVRSDRWRGPGLTASLALTMAGYFLSYQADYAFRTTACTIVGFATLIAAAARADLRGEPSPWRGRISVKLGEVSFAFYMVHILVIRTGESLFGGHPKLPMWSGGLLALAAAFCVSLALAWALHTWVELPGRRLLLRSWSSGRATSATGTSAASRRETSRTTP
ncbi:acyltransferase [Streptomyces sp. RerS4]|uniref:acyltransferase family protein n=1 Tax=Streptomyces sp. RerS4 TaxID=2942449 RepID=UPI00201BAD14|nr:acyltransferase [Streptomyces sp. RerS4]UQX01930.1 acyltransferase [Streptomyces sp. RerS4]